MILILIDNPLFKQGYLLIKPLNSMTFRNTKLKHQTIRYCTYRSRKFEYQLMCMSVCTYIKTLSPSLSSFCIWNRLHHLQLFPNLVLKCPYLEYWVPLWAAQYERDMDILERNQEGPGRWLMDWRERLRELGPLSWRRLRGDLINIYI